MTRVVGQKVTHWLTFFYRCAYDLSTIQQQSPEFLAKGDDGLVNINENVKGWTATATIRKMSSGNDNASPVNIFQVSFLTATVNLSEKGGARLESSFALRSSNCLNGM
uniref:Uncharacterized protein n=1 Tax=Romanomermis culicivorax TaxID=13658 RepID=A0A915JWS0_ROMCU